jgi:hypothetical protein
MSVLKTPGVRSACDSERCIGATSGPLRYARSNRR